MIIQDFSDSATPGDFKPGQRVQLHPGTDAWMRGDMYGRITLVGRKWVSVKMDRSGRTLRVAAHLLQVRSGP